MTDTELVRHAKAGDLAAFEELVTRYERRVFSLAHRMLDNQQDAEDVTQQSFLSALEHLAGFREESSFYTWLMRIASHAALKVIRKRRGLPAESLEELSVPHPEFIATWKESPAKIAQQNETGQLIEDALAQLDEKHRLVFLLRDVEGLSVKETAEATGLSDANVKVRLLRARLQLRERLTRLFGDPSTRLIPHAH
ncbi:MAG TPA: sigma-70 family RNA polymerase sigma factor [Verrucomicrobiae bacterium]|nr:sigma-70 family RNA polymerase sigma factor [Verrucomicrobiae bacterium]